MTKPGDILDEFFSPISKEKLWIMREGDEYTQTILRWPPVTDAVSRIKFNLTTDCLFWRTMFNSRADWVPTMNDAKKFGAHQEFVYEPPGTDPATCAKAFAIYVGTKQKIFPLPSLPLVPPIQTNDLYTCPIGSFNIYTTYDAIDCSAKTATLNFWMYNSMSRKS